MWSRPRPTTRPPIRSTEFRSSSKQAQDDCYVRRRPATLYAFIPPPLSTTQVPRSPGPQAPRPLMASSSFAQDHSYPPLPPTPHDITRSETNYSSASTFAKNRYLPDDDGDTEAQPLPKEGSSQWDQPPPPEPQRPARRWWQGVRIHTTTYSLFILVLSPR